MRELTTMAAALAILSSSAAVADNPQQVAKGEKDPQQRIVCISEQIVGSIIPRRICKTKADWEQGAIDAKAALDQKRLTDDPIKLCGRCGG